jgi:hypothetical protein
MKSSKRLRQVASPAIMRITTLALQQPNGDFLRKIRHRESNRFFTRFEFC